MISELETLRVLLLLLLLLLLLFRWLSKSQPGFERLGSVVHVSTSEDGEARVQAKQC